MSCFCIVLQLLQQFWQTGLIILAQQVNLGMLKQVAQQIEIIAEQITV